MVIVQPLLICWCGDVPVFAASLILWLLQASGDVQQTPQLSSLCAGLSACGCSSCGDQGVDCLGRADGDRVVGLDSMKSPDFGSGL